MLQNKSETDKCISIHQRILYNLTEISVWRVNIVLLKQRSKFGAIPTYLDASDPFRTNCIRTGRCELVRLAFRIMEIGQRKAFSEQIKIRKVSTETQVSQL